MLPDLAEGPYTASSMMGIPPDSAEGYLFEFHMNLLVLQFLRATNALSSKQEESTIEHLNNSEYELTPVCAKTN